MEIRVLRYFLEVAREGNITKSAAYLHISQPTLSRQLKELEEELGKKLFVRSNYSVKLTEEGMLLRKRAEDILDMVDKTTEEFRALDEINGGDIHIGCAESNGIFGEAQDKLNIVATYDLLFNTSVMVREGFGCVLGFDGLVYTGPDSDLCFRPLEPTLTSPMYIIWKKYQVFSPVASLLLEELKRNFG